MRHVRVGLCLVSVLAAVPQSADAWGFAGHRLVTRQAIALLPPALKPFYVQFADEFVLRSVDPDLWRSVGWDEGPNHFLDLGVREYGPFPFRALPRDYGAALEKFGLPTLKRNGLLPWRGAEQFGALRRAFEDLTRGRMYSTSDIVLFSAVAAHYVQDAYQPFHATDNFDGNQTGNGGIHARFERDLIERFEKRLTLRPSRPAAMTNPQDALFDATMEGHQLVDGILQADRVAIGGRSTYDDQYFEAFFSRVQPVLERQLSSAITATAALITGAWEQAGRPQVPLRETRPVERARPRR